MNHRFADTSAGRLHYLHAGQGPALVLLHSNGGSAHDFETVFERLARNHEVFAWDQPGQGDSDPLTRHWTVADYTDALVEFMDAVGLKRASVLGVSIGGAICANLGARHPARLARLFIVECPWRSEEEWARMWPRVEGNFALPVQSMDAVAPRVNKVDEDFLRRWNIDRCKAGAKTMMGVMWALREYDPGPDLAACPPGTIAVFGDKGPTIAARAAFGERLPQAEVHVIADCGHFPNFDHPDDFCDLIERHTLATP